MTNQPSWPTTQMLSLKKPKKGTDTIPEEEMQEILFVDEDYLKESGKFNKIIGNKDIFARKIYECFNIIEAQVLARKR